MPRIIWARSPHGDYTYADPGLNPRSSTVGELLGIPRYLPDLGPPAYPVGPPPPVPYGPPEPPSAVLYPEPARFPEPPDLAQNGVDNGQAEVRSVLPGSGGQWDVVWGTPVRVPPERLEEYGVILPRRPALPPPPVRAPAPTPQTEKTSMPDIDWGGTLPGILGDLGSAYIQSRFAPASPPPMAPWGTASPSGAVIDPVTGRVCKRRRRRRRLLTPTDLSDLAALKTITGNNDALKYAVMKAVRK